jgi:hypothetical protein
MGAGRRQRNKAPRRLGRAEISGDLGGADEDIVTFVVDRLAGR